MDETQHLLNRNPEVTEAEQQEMQKQIEAAIERDKLDPRQQSYMYNKSTKLLIRNNAQYHRAVENHHEIEVVTYARAEAIYKEEEARKRKALAERTKGKRAKQARKRNR